MLALSKGGCRHSGLTLTCDDDAGDTSLQVSKETGTFAILIIMKGSDYALLVFTFVVGVFAGGYLYVTVFVPSVAEQQAARGERDWEIYGEEIGECRQSNDCAELFVASDRTLRFSIDGSEMLVATVSRELRSRLRTALEDYEPSSVGPGCQSVTGRFYAYDVAAFGDRYEVATCSQRFAESELATVLDEVWRYAEAGDYNAPPVIIEKGLTGWLEQQLDKQFDYDD